MGGFIEVSTSTDSFSGFAGDIKTLTEMGKPLSLLEERIALSFKASKAPSVSVIVCTRDRPAQLARCLGSLQNLSHKPDEICVVDNASRSDETCTVTAGFGDVHYVYEPKPGLNVARNKGIRQSSGDIIAFVDDDVTVHGDWLDAIQGAFVDLGVMAVTGLALPAELKTQAQYLFETHWGFGRGYQDKVFGRQFFERFRSRGVPVLEIGAGANMAFRRRVFDDVGLFDERLDVGAAGCSGDSEMWYRILARGGICHYVPTAVVYHYHRPEMEAFHRQLFYYMRGHVTALLIQFERHRHWGNLRRMLLSLPVYYAGLMIHGLLYGFSGRKSTLKSEILGCLSGVKFYLNQKQREKCN
ncbi:MAG: glycosyltransferase [Deltaproteobacteria bacterium]|nr:glycosyltransferase [Deltaproteobacteria bacterium]